MILKMFSAVRRRNPVLASQGWVWSGRVRCGTVRRGVARFGGSGQVGVRLGTAGAGVVRCGLASQGPVLLGSARRGMVSSVMAW